MRININTRYYLYIKERRKLSYQDIADMVKKRTGENWSRQRVYDLMKGRNKSLKSHKTLTDTLCLNLRDFYMLEY